MIAKAYNSFYIFVIVFGLSLFAPSDAQSQPIAEYADFPGGIDAFFEFVKNEITYPPSALQDSLEGNVYVNFLINSNGDVVSEAVEITQGIAPVLDQEALRIIKKSPRWIPAKKTNGMAVEQMMTFPVTFKLPTETE